MAPPTETQDKGDSAAPAAERGSVRVAWISGAEHLDAFARCLKPLAVGLMDELIEVVLFCGETAAEPSLPPVSVVRFSPPGLLGATGAKVRRLTDRIGQEKIELLHVLDADLAELTRKAAAASGLNYVADCLTMGAAARLKGAEPAPAVVIAPSAPIRQEAIEQGVLEAEKIHLIRPGVHRVAEPTCFADADRRVSIVAGGPVDRLWPFEALLEAFAELRDRGFNCAFFIIGGGRAEPDVRSAARRLDLVAEITFVQYQSSEQFTEILAGADVYVSLCRPRRADMRTLLAMSAAAVVLSTPDPAADYLVNGQTALLLGAGDAGELTTKLVALLDDPAAARSLAAKALSHVAARHSPAAGAAALARLYRRILAPRKV